LLIDPPPASETVQFTFVFVTPLTVAVKASVAEGGSVTIAGVTATCGGKIVTAEVPTAFGTALLVAEILKGPP
jgi:hypothetical protein